MTILCGGPWIMGRSSLLLKKWSPNMDMSDAFFETIPIWVKLSGLPLEYWHEDIFKGIVGVFGETLSIDPMTTAKKRMVYAKIYVGVSRSKDLPLLIELVSKLGTLVQTIEFESLPFVCFLCKKKPKTVEEDTQNKKGDFVHQKGPNGSHETNKKNVVQHGQNDEKKRLVEDLEEGELSLNPNRSKDMEERSFKDRQSSPVLGSSFGTLEFNELKKTLEDDSSSQHSTYNLPDFDLNIVIPDTLQSPKIDSFTGLEGIDFDEEMSYTKVVSKKKKSHQKP
ncbi:hypothetical protein SUGI_0330910 [Cryptomeria japonica]|nr:hypothetical protein SUGI_0330910 [Cryptomeria japonica]